MLPCLQLRAPMRKKVSSNVEPSASQDSLKTCAARAVRTTEGSGSSIFETIEPLWESSIGELKSPRCLTSPLFRPKCCTLAETPVR